MSLFFLRLIYQVAYIFRFDRPNRQSPTADLEKTTIENERKNNMNQELLDNKELQSLISSLETEDEPDQPLGKYGRMAMDYLHSTDPQRFSLLKMTGKLMGMIWIIKLIITI